MPYNIYEKSDFWAEKARKEGYPARSVYKLRQLDEKFALFGAVKKGRTLRVLDLGAAPGSWSLYVLRKLRDAVCLTGCDLKEICLPVEDVPSDRFTALQGDFTDPAIRARIQENGPYDFVLSDAAPSTSGNRTLDAARSATLAEAALDYACAMLVPGGHCVVKIFQGGDTAELIGKPKAHFDKVRTWKPEACRPSSFETYLVALGRKPASCPLAEDEI